MSKNKATLKKIRETIRKQKLFLKAKARENKFQHHDLLILKKKKFIIDTDLKLIEQTRNQVFNDFANLITPGSGELTIKIPPVFCFSSHYSDSMRVIKEFASSMYDNLGSHILIDFSKCTKVDSAALFIFQIVRLEITNKLNFLQKKLRNHSVIPDLEVKVPKSKDVIRLLIIMGYPISEEDVKDLDDDSTLHPFHFLGFLKGSKSQKHYFENRKSVYSASIVNYLNSCLDEHGYTLSEIETNNIDGIVSEVLSNAEDHSGKPFWYITANFSKEMSQIGDEDVGELNLVIMNFGNSIYEAFLETQEQNKEMFLAVENYVKRMLRNSDEFNEEQLFTLATMQEQTSRLKFERQSRGTGTIKFINSFLDLGDFIDKSKGFVPNMSIFSGNVHLVCDLEFKPSLINNIYCLSLNPENNLAIPPRTTHLKKLKSKFPGTLLSLKLYLNKKHFDNKYGGNYGN